jgi:hypothetical protein
MKRVFLIGNGESRKGFDLNILKPFGRIYGCNAIYREFTPDVLVSVDHGIMHEIYHRGYCYKNETWFRDWTRCPDFMYESLIYAGLSKVDIDELKKWHVKNENTRTDEKEFVMHGANLSGIVKILHRDKNKIEEKNINSNQLAISWVKDNDKAKNINDVMPNNIDFGWAAGPTSGYISVVKESPTEVFLIGHDLNTTTGNVNNIYKDTKHYMASYNKQTEFEKWINQLKTIFTNNPDIQFYKVNNSLNPLNTDDKVNVVWQEFNGIKNLQYITYEALDKRLQL